MIKTVIGIEGMACEMCEAHISQAIRRSFVVKSAKASRRKRQCVVISEEPLDEAAVRGAVVALGYDVLSVRSEPYQGRGIFGRA